MVGHYVRLALRLLGKHRLYASINILGLSIAFGLAALIFLFVRDEFSYDDWHENGDRIYRVDRVDYYPDGAIEGQGPWMPYPFAEALKRDHAAVEYAVRMTDDNVELAVDGQISERSVLFVDSTFFDVFAYEVLRGSAGTALTDPASLVVTESAALRHWNTLDVVGRQVELRFEDTYEPAVVTAVVADPPSNTNIPFEYLLPFHRTPMVYEWIANRTDRWNASSFTVFAMLHEGADRADAQATLAGLWRRYYPDQADQMRSIGSWTGEGDPASYALVALDELHLSPNIPGALVASSNPVYSLILVAIGLTILALACINFTVLAVARGATRAAEIGVRKAMGAQRRQLMLQFTGESVLLSVMALGIGVAIARMLIPVFNALANKQLALDLAGAALVIPAMLMIALVTGLVAGWYPSLVISRHRPSEALRGRFSLGGSNRFSRALVVSQFVASIVLVAGALIMNQQLRHVQSRDLGYDPDNVLVVHANGKDGAALAEHLRRTIGTQAGVDGIAAVTFSMNRGLDNRGWMDGERELRATVYGVEPAAPGLLGVELVAGRLLSPDLASDSTSAALVNESFAASIGFTAEEAVGEVIPGYGQDTPTMIAGVIRDLNFRSLHHSVDPMMMTMEPDGRFHYALVRFSGSPVQIIDGLQDAWAGFATDIPLEYTFLDEDVAMVYANDRRWSRVVQYAAGLAILIACLGLFGLAALAVSRRTKEIGIRKVLGASVAGILVLVSRDFAKLVGIATLVAAPIAWFALNRWLEGFAYHVNPSVAVFFVAGLIVLGLALVTVGVHSLRAALANPVDSLRYE